MAEPPPESSYTPPDVSINASPSPHDSMEDLDPQATRKRPRLDSGSGVSPTLSLDGTSRTASVAPASDMDEVSDSGRVASKVTINMKSPLSHLDPTEPELPDPNSKLLTDTDGAPHVIALSSTPSSPRSPEIQVAEPEDMDQDPTASNWRPLEQVMQDQEDPEVIEIQDTPTLADTFPKLDEDFTHRENFKALGDILELGHPRESQAIVAVKRWLHTCAQELDRITLEEYTADYEFWDTLPHVVESLLRRQPELQVDSVEDIWTFFEEFFLDYSRIVLQLVQLDSLVLSRLTGESGIDPPLSTSHRYLFKFSWVFNSPTVPFFVVLHKKYPDECLSLIARLKDQLSSSTFDGPGVLLQYASHVLNLLPKSPSLFAYLPTTLSIALLFFDASIQQLKNGVVSPDSSSTIDKGLQSLYDTARAVDKEYEVLVAKKSPVVTNEASTNIVSVLFRIYNFLCMVDPDFMFQLADELKMTLPENTSVDQTKMCVAWTWKFDALKRQIMEGRMELRVNGVETIQSDLVNLWSNHVSQNPDNPFVHYLVQLLRSNKLLEYLMGIDSHPQLISRASNIFGFFIVTGNYENRDTDMIWKVVTDGQDERTVEAVVDMLGRTLGIHTSTSGTLLYICAKLLELPLDRFDGYIIDFCSQLIPRMQEKPGERDYRVISPDEDNAIPLKLCVRLIRESAGADLPSEKKEMMQQFGSQQLVNFMKAGLSESDKAETYEACIQDIADMNACTAGSIQVLNALVSCDGSRELGKLATEFDLTHLVITELHHFVDHLPIPNDLSSQHAFASRVELLRRIIDLAPETITPELGNTLWQEILMSDKLPRNERLIIWKMAQSMTLTTRSNQFVERCIHEYLPEVSPKCYSYELLAFAQQTVFYDIRLKAPPITGEDEVIAVPGMDRIWNLILTAPPNTIENEAIKFAIELYLDHVIISRSPRSAIDATHIALVRRCVNQLKSAAPALKSSRNAEANGDVAMEAETQNEKLSTEELIFDRSLLFLRQLLHGLRSRPRYTSPRSQSSSPPNVSEHPLKGAAVNIRYQCFGGTPSNKVNTLVIGELSTASELADILVQSSRFSKFSLIFGGRKLELLEKPDALIKDLDLGAGLLLVRKTPDAHIITSPGMSRSMTAVDKEVLKHFDELYDMLDLKDHLARRIIDFLVVFPPQGQAVELVKSHKNSEKEMFPLTVPYKALYSVNTLSMCLHDVPLAVDVDAQQEFVSHSLKVLVAFITLDELSNSLKDDSIVTVIAAKALECLSLAISVYHPTDTNAALISDPATFVPRVLSFIEIGRSKKTSHQPMVFVNGLVCYSFAVLVEASLSDQNIWNTVKQHVNFDDMMSSLLLEQDQRQIRKETQDRLKIVSGPAKPLETEVGSVEEESLVENPIRVDMLATIWSSIVNIIPRARYFVGQSEEFFSTALFVFRSVAGRSPHDVMFSTHMKQWTAVLLDHNTEEFVGREPVDNLVIGLCSLLEWCLELAIFAKVPLDSGHIAEQLLNKYLFPDFIPETGDHNDLQTPIMHTYTRQRLYNVVTLLCEQSDETYGRILELLDSTVPRESSYIEHSYERHSMIRSNVGYAGLRNLSNTCYLNSLTTQLFMNIEFRDFILNLHIADPVAQKLLFETQKLFTWMQETWRKSIEPHDFVESIQTYDNEQIDVTVQMDVDEFYNLLFDRWEAQILDPEMKKSFRSFYGGQLVQQIKSMECDHISEREEPFSAIQCEIKGKASLEDSLRAYVAGEVMQGDNKYSCTSCGRHVDAVKRACLKDVPDNLIFHLKRFDFDMLTMLRSKINDEFQFPRHIDMAPYTVEHLSNPNEPVEPDMFELVGVLVHTGTAESGHYYSYTLERPSPGGQASWVEFNDSEVTRFDPTSLSAACFGGAEPSSQYVNGSQKDKMWSAYMLFYQRVSSIEKCKSMYTPPKTDIPVHISVPDSIQNHIAMDNELLIRTYCLLDPQYAFFVDRLLQRWSRMSPGEEKTKAETLAINVGMDTIEQLISRTKYLQGLDEICRDLNDMIETSSSAAQAVIRWVSDRPGSIRNIVTKTPIPEVRAKEVSLIHGALKHLHSLSNDPTAEPDEQQQWRIELEIAIERVTLLLIEIWPSVQCLPRIWDDYFDFFNKLCTCGPSAVQILLDRGVFVMCLHILWIDHEDKKDLRVQYPNYVRLMDKGRRFPFGNFMVLCLTFFENIDLSLKPPRNGDNREFSVETGRFSARECELELITPTETDGSLSLLAKILRHWAISRTHSARMIIAELLNGEPKAGLLDAIIKTLESGLRMEPAIQCVPFLEAAVVFCQYSPDWSRIVDVVNYIACGIDTIDNSGGQEHMDFFTQICDLTNQRLNLGPRDFTKLTLGHLPTIAPVLLIDRDEIVRQNMQSILDEAFAGYQNAGTAEQNDQENEQENESGNLSHVIVRDELNLLGRLLQKSCAERLTAAFLKEQTRPIDVRQLESILSVINYCLTTFYDDNDADEAEVQKTRELLTILRNMSLQEVPDDPASGTIQSLLPLNSEPVTDPMTPESEVASGEEWDANSVIVSDSDGGVRGSP
ncbi:unnamed protein product [Penicillium salamii]|nr:unnamed protein product [Penicillium salamii]CAG8156756.1 unnamed protein product [Penicillium salamii]CAG8380787.1 unnamed protein product [Penicillium salamii]